MELREFEVFRRFEGLQYLVRQVSLALEASLPSAVMFALRLLARSRAPLDWVK